MKPTFSNMLACCTWLMFQSSGSVPVSTSRSNKQPAPRGDDIYPAAVGNPINVKSFGAVGDGKHDDGPSIQQAIDSVVGKAEAALYFPTGVYHTNQTIVANSWAIRFVGDGMSLSVVVAGAPMVATLILPGAQPNTTVPAPRSRTNGFEIDNMAFSGSGHANFAVYAPALTRSRFTRVGFHDGRVAGFYLGYGWINDIFQCSFSGKSLVGLYLDLAVNSINVLDSMFEANGELGVGMIINGGAMVRLSGNCLEGLAGPGIIANQVDALTIQGNYFEDNNVSPDNFTFVSNATGTPSRVRVCTDILLDGDFGFAGSWSSDNSLSIAQFAPGAAPMVTKPDQPAHWNGKQGDIRLNNHAPTRGVVLEGNFHNPSADGCPGGSPPYSENTFYGAFAAGVTGLRSESNDCGACSNHASHTVGPARTCVAVGTGPQGPNTNQSLQDFDIKLNTGFFGSGPL